MAKSCVRDFPWLRAFGWPWICHITSFATHEADGALKFPIVRSVDINDTVAN